MAEVDPETRACAFARKNLKSDPARALEALSPGVSLDEVILTLIDIMGQRDSMKR
jgi:hypothetical protein